MSKFFKCHVVNNIKITIKVITIIEYTLLKLHSLQIYENEKRQIPHLT